MKIVICLLTATLFLFPPHEQKGTWLDHSTLHSPSEELQSRLDRDYFGLSPEYHFIGQIRKTFHEEQTLVKMPQGAFRLTTSQTKVNWLVFCVQIAALLLMSALYFIYASKKRVPRAHPN